MFKNNRGSEKRSSEKCGGWEMMFRKPDVELQEFLRNEIRLISLFSDGNVKVGNDIWEK